MTHKKVTIEICGLFLNNPDCLFGIGWKLSSRPNSGRNIVT